MNPTPQKCATCRHAIGTGTIIMWCWELNKKTDRNFVCELYERDGSDE